MIRKIYRKIFPRKAPSITPNNVVIGENCSIDPSSLIFAAKNAKIIFSGNNYIGRNVEIGTEGLIEFGTNTSIQDRSIILGDVEIGNFCTFAPNIYISSGRHYYDFIPNYYIKDQDELNSNDKVRSKEHSKKVIIGDDCWLGINSVIMSGVTIGRGSVIGANAVVTKNVEPFSVMTGAPAKLLKKRLDFIPKSFLRFDNDNDLPNFYSGLFVDLKNLKESRFENGIFSSSKFSFYMINNGNKLILKIKKIPSANLILLYNNQEIELKNNGYETLSFNADQVYYHHFSIKNEIDKKSKFLLIESIEILN